MRVYDGMYDMCMNGWGACKHLWAMNMPRVWLHIWHPYAWIMCLRASACHETRPRLLHVSGVCIQKQGLWGHADVVMHPWNVICIWHNTSCFCVYYSHIQHASKSLARWSSTRQASLTCTCVPYASRGILKWFSAVKTGLHAWFVWYFACIKKTFS